MIHEVWAFWQYCLPKVSNGFKDEATFGISNCLIVLVLYNDWYIQSTSNLHANCLYMADWRDSCSNSEAIHFWFLINYQLSPSDCFHAMPLTGNFLKVYKNNYLTHGQTTIQWRKQAPAPPTDWWCLVLRMTSETSRNVNKITWVFGCVS